jgi:hypothetical protein
MADYDKKKEGVTTEADNTPTTGIGVAQQIFQDQYDSLGDQYAAEQAAVDAQQAKYKAQAEKVAKARESGTSVFGAILEETKPVYDANKEKRLRNRAIVQSLGDMLSAVAMGAHAYGKKGAGYVPKPTEGGHLLSLSEIDKMREEYRKRGEAWKTLNLGIKKSQAEAAVAAEEKLLTVEAAKLKDATTKAEATRKAQADLLNAWNKSVADYYIDMDKEKVKDANAQKRDERNHEYRMEEAKVKGKSKADSNEMTDEQEALRVFAFSLYGDEAYGKSSKKSTRQEPRKDIMGNVVGYDDVTTTTEEQLSWDDLGSGARADKYAEWRKDATIKGMMDVYNDWINTGLTPEEAREKVLNGIEEDNGKEV